MFQVSPVYEAARPKFIAELRQYAVGGQRELSLLVDADTGVVIDRQEGTVDEVSPDWDRVRPGQRVVALHSHPNSGGPGGEDWDVLCVQRQVGRLEVVDTALTHIVEKPEPWEFQETVSSAAQRQGMTSRGVAEWISPFRSLFDRTLGEVRQDFNFAGREQHAQIEETNQRMLKWPYLRHFRIRKERHF